MNLIYGACTLVCKHKVLSQGIRESFEKCKGPRGVAAHKGR